MVQAAEFGGLKPSGCSVPECGGVSFCRHAREVGQARKRRDHARRPSRDTAVAGFDRGAEPAIRDQPEDGGDVAQARERRRCADGTEGTPLVGSQQGGRGAGRRLPRHTLLPPDDCPCALQPTIPHLTRSSLHRCFVRHEISRLPEVGGSKPKAAFKVCPIGASHIGIAEGRTGEGKLHLLLAIDRTSKFAFAEPQERVTRRLAADCRRRRGTRGARRWPPPGRSPVSRPPRGSRNAPAPPNTSSAARRRRAASPCAAGAAR